MFVRFQCVDLVKTANKLALFGDIDLHADGSGTSFESRVDSQTTEALIDLGRALYKLLFQLLLVIESDNKMLNSIILSIRQNDKMQDYSSVLTNIRGTILRCLDETDYDSLDTSISTEGENLTPTPSPGLPMSYQEFETMLVDLVESQRWSAVITHVKQFLQLSGSGSLGHVVSSSSNVSPSATAAAAAVGGMGGGVVACLPDSQTDDIPTLITKIYSQRLTRDRNGECE